MVKTYEKYEQSASFGVINSGSSNVVWTPDESAGSGTAAGAAGAAAGAPGSGAGLAYVGSNEDVLCWNTKTGDVVSRWHDSTCRSEVSVVARSQVDPDVFAIGYSNGSIRLWDSKTQTLLFSFDGHRSEITALAFDESGTRLASGSRDTNIIIWDLITETGAFKLRGHKDQIVSLHFVHPNPPSTEDDEDAAPVDLADKTTGGFLLSASSEALVKLWDLSTQHCIETHVTQLNGGCWSIGLSPDKTTFVTGGNEGEMKIWFLDHAALARAQDRVDDLADQRILIERGTLQRNVRDRTTGVEFHPTMSYFSVHGTSKVVEIWRVRSEDEVVRSLVRKAKRRKEKAKEQGREEEKDGDGDGAVAEAVEAKPTLQDAQISDIFVSHVLVRPSGPVRSCDWVRSKVGRGTLQVIVSTRNNQLETYSFPTRDRKSKTDTPAGLEATRVCGVDIPGHRTDVRAIGLSSDDRMLATASNGSLKIWNVKTQTCLRTLECGYALALAFLPGDKIVVVGTKAGDLELFDIASSTLIERVEAHEGAVWSLKVHPDGKSMVTGSADKSAKFWNFKVVQDEVPGTNRTVSRLKLVQTRVLKMSDDILNVCFSPDGRLLAVASLDTTVKVFFVDSLKLFLNLYGHKLPVLNMSITADSKVLATCSADKNIRIWGLDFGDCHKALFAHQDSIMQVAFPAHPVSKDEGRYLFSASKDKTVKQWDTDKFEKIQELGGHHGEVWAMAMSQTGDFVVTASHDKSIRTWTRTGEPLFLQEERERELEAIYEANLADDIDGDGDGGADGEVGTASKQTSTTLTAGERITEALEIGIEDLELVRSWTDRKRSNPNLAPPQRNPLLMALNVSAERHVLNTVARIPPSQLHDALLVLSFSAVPSLLTFVDIWLTKRWNPNLVCRVLFFIVKTHHHQIVATGNGEMRMMLETVRDRVRDCLVDRRNLMGFNQAGMTFLDGRIRDAGIRTIEDVDELEQDHTRGRAKRAFVHVS